jgi:hypothetical protein
MVVVSGKATGMAMVMAMVMTKATGMMTWKAIGKAKGKAALLIKCICVLTFNSNLNIQFDNTLIF